MIYRYLTFLLAATLAASSLAATKSTKRKGGFQPPAEEESTPKPKPKSSSKTKTSGEKPDEEAPTGTPAKTKSKSKATTKSVSEDENAPTASPTPKPKSKSSKSKSTKPSAESTPKPEPKVSPSEEPKAAASTVETEKPTGNNGMLGPMVASLTTDSLSEFNQQPEWLQIIIKDALALSDRNLGYLFGSDNPSNGGMDCSGTIYYILRSHGFKDVPRDSGSQYGWLKNRGTLRTLADADAARFESRSLRPGDLLFWTGTYDVQREIPISHVMLFLGTEKKNGKPVMWGASDGRTYDGKQRYGVSVFDFRLPKAESKSKFVGFGQLPMP